MQQVADDKKSDARTRLLEAAIDVFGRYGYESATTRRIAGAADVNIAAIPYYFGGKEGLYRAVISHIVSLIQDQVAPLRSGREGFGPVVATGADDAFALLQAILEKIIDFIVGSAEGPRIARIILREQMYPSDAYNLIYDGFMAPMLEGIASCVMVVCGDISVREAKFRAMAILGQVLAFRVARETIVRSLDLHGYDRQELGEIRAIILAHTRSVLGFTGQLAE